MNKTIFLTLLFSCLASGLWAQVAYKDAQGRFVIDNSALPINARKTAAEVANTIGADGLVASHSQGSAMNLKLSPKFEIAGVNESSNGTETFDTSEMAQLCKNKDGGNQGWRLPTQRELLLLLLLKPQLEALPGFTAFSTTINIESYKCSTGFSYYWNYTFLLRMSSGEMFTTTYDNRELLRCVRDL